ncbi:MAG: nuclear transport factor 2 family protein, partial [Pseudomonadota bacterium]
DFEALTNRFTNAVETADFEGFGALFTEDGVYHDEFYGAFEGRDAVVDMLRNHFYGSAKNFKWVMEDAAYSEPFGYVRYIFSYDSILPGCEDLHVVFEGMSQFTIRDGQIARYREIFDKGMPLTQLNFPADRIEKSLRRWTQELLASDRAQKM